MSPDPVAGGAVPPSDQSDRTNTSDESAHPRPSEPSDITGPTAAQLRHPADQSLTVPDVAERGRRRIDHALALVDSVLENLDSEADDAALRRARSAAVNASGDFDELEAMRPHDI